MEIKSNKRKIINIKKYIDKCKKNDGNKTRKEKYY